MDVGPRALRLHVEEIFGVVDGRTAAVRWQSTALHDMILRGILQIKHGMMWTITTASNPVERQEEQSVYTIHSKKSK